MQQNLRNGPLSPSELVQAVVVDTEVVGHLMDHRAPDDLAHGLRAARLVLDVRLVECDAVGEKTVVVGSSLGQRHALVESEQALDVSVLDVFGAGELLYDYVEVADAGGQLWGKLVQSLVDDLFELLGAQGKPHASDVT